MGFSESKTELSSMMIYIGLEELERRRDLLPIFSFPFENLEYALNVLEDLRRLGVKDVAFTQMKGRLTPIILGKGYRGIVFKARTKDGDVALKVLRIDSTISSLEQEAEATSLANRVKVGPLLLGYSSYVLVLELVEGTPLDVWLREVSCEDFGKLRRLLRMCFEDARRLDQIRLDHGELSDARKHVIIRSDLKPVIIDFGRASIRRRPSNVTSLFSYLMFGPRSLKIRRMLKLSATPFKEVREYKRLMSQEAFTRLMEALNLV